MVAAKAVKTALPPDAAAPGPLRPALPIEQWPDKLLFRIGELAELLGVETHVVRFWLKEFPQVRTERSDTNRLLFSRSAAEKLWRIRELLYAQGYTLAGARKALAARPAKPAEPVSDGPNKRETELQRQVEALQAELKALQARLSASQAGEAAARARLQHDEAQRHQGEAQLQQALADAAAQQQRAEQLAAKVQQEAALAQHFQQAMQLQQQQLAQQAQQANSERDQRERERWSDLAAALGDLAADIRG